MDIKLTVDSFASLSSQRIRFNAERKIQFHFLSRSRVDFAVTMDTEAVFEISPMCRGEKIHRSEQNFTEKPSSLKRIQIDSVLLHAGNYFYIIYRFARAVEIEKHFEIYAMPPYTVGDARKTFTWDQMRNSRALWKKPANDATL